MKKPLALVIIAFVVGVVHSFLAPKLDAAIPATWKGNRWMQSFFTGAFIIVALIASTFVLRALKVPVAKVA